jgi:predicted DNA-binding protein
MKIFMDLESQKVKEKKVMYSTSLPKGLKDSLQKASDLLHRKKADWVRASLNLFLGLAEKDQEALILKAYQDMEVVHLRPFTTTLTEYQLNSLYNLAKKLKRSKADIIRTAIFFLLSQTPTDQEKEIKKNLTR